MEFHQVQWDESLIDDCRQLIRLAVREDLGRLYDFTTLSVVPEEARARAVVVARAAGTISGLRVAELVLEEMNVPASWSPKVTDGDSVVAGDVVAVAGGPARDLLTAERLILNFLGRLSGVASLTRRYVDAVAVAVGGKTRVYDTRKTTPAWRRLEKYAVRCGGGHNHRTGLFDAVLIKDNHLVQVEQSGYSSGECPMVAVRRARAFLAEYEFPAPLPIEVEVDTLEQLVAVLAETPDLVLVDNMSLEDLRSAVQIRDKANVATELEASGGISLETIGEVAGTGVERISVGALTHSANWLDLAVDWE